MEHNIGILITTMVRYTILICTTRGTQERFRLPVIMDPHDYSKVRRIREYKDSVAMVVFLVDVKGLRVACLDDDQEDKRTRAG